MNDSPLQVALAILYQGNSFLMQLRDDIPGIFYPGHWGLFGGHLEQDETPESALKREILEELNYQIVDYDQFRSYEDTQVLRYVFYAPLTVSTDSLILGEGWDFKLLSLEEIRSGSGYSEKAGGHQPIGKIHQQILLDFLNWQNLVGEKK